MKPSTELGSLLKKLRKENHYTQEQVAAKLFVSRQAVSTWENGAATPDVPTLGSLSTLYHVPLETLIGKLYNSDTDSTLVQTASAAEESLHEYSELAVSAATESSAEENGAKSNKPKERPLIIDILLCSAFVLVIGVSVALPLVGFLLAMIYFITLRCMHIKEKIFFIVSIYYLCGGAFLLFLIFCPSTYATFQILYSKIRLFLFGPYRPL